MPAGMRWEWRCLDVWLPVCTEIFVDYAFGSYQVAFEFFIPATNKPVIQGDRSFCICSHGCRKIGFCFLCRYAYNIHPMPRWREFFCGEHNMPGHIHLKRIVVPK